MAYKCSGVSLAPSLATAVALTGHCSDGRGTRTAAAVIHRKSWDGSFADFHPLPTSLPSALIVGPSQPAKCVKHHPNHASSL